MQKEIHKQAKFYLFAIQQTDSNYPIHRPKDVGKEFLLQLTFIYVHITELLLNKCKIRSYSKICFLSNELKNLQIYSKLT